MTALHHDVTFAAVAPLLTGAKQILEVGCGSGFLARKLSGLGYDVTAIDLRLDPKTISDPPPNLHFREINYLQLSGGPYDAIVFTSSLHHISPLAAAVEKTRSLLRPGGVLVADEFSLEAPDEATARWNYENLHLLAAAGLIDGAHFQGDLRQPPQERWHHEHHHHEPLSTAEQMIAAIKAHFKDVTVTTGPYLFRYISSSLLPSDRAESVARYVYDREKALISAGVLRPVGRLIVAR